MSKILKKAKIIVSIDKKDYLGEHWYCQEIVRVNKFASVKKLVEAKEYILRNFDNNKTRKMMIHHIDLGDLFLELLKAIRNDVFESA